MGGRRGMRPFVETEEFRALNVGFGLDEGLASPTEEFPVFYAERSVWRKCWSPLSIPGVTFPALTRFNLQDFGHCGTWFPPAAQHCWRKVTLHIAENDGITQAAGAASGE